MRSIWVAFFSAGLVACSGAPTTEQDPAGVEERKPADSQSAQTQPVKPGQVARVDLTGKPAGKSPLTDPANILSRRSIFYDLDQYDIKDQYKDLVEAHARYLRDNSGARMTIEGNCDERGSREYNIALGQRRAEGVRRMLMLMGATGSQVESVSLGEEKPRCEDHSEGCWSQNRRSDMLYGGEY